MNPTQITFNPNNGVVVSQVTRLTPSGLSTVIINNGLAKDIIAYADSISFSSIKSLAAAIIFLGFNTAKAFVIDSLTNNASS